nr:coenzyme A pyrophosphatase [Dokdonella sp.]
LDCFDTVSGFSVSPVVAVVRDGFALAPDPREVAEVFEVPLEYILEPGRMQRSEILWHGRGREIFEFDYDGKRIWGATAAILQNLLRRLETET